MTVSASSTVATHTGNGVQTSFSYSFKNYAAADLDVYVNKILQVSGYSVTINTDFNGGSVVFSVAPTNTHAIKILRKQDQSQTYDPQPGQGFSESDLEAAFDKQTMLIQELKEQADRSARVPTYVNGFDAEFPEPVASKIPRFNAANNGWELVDSATIVTEGGGGGSGGGGGAINTIGLTVPTDVLSVTPGSLSTDGTFAISKVSQSQNTVACGPTSGSGAWTFRALVEADIPSLSASKIGSGTLAKAVQNSATVYNDQSNTYSGSFTQDFGASTQTLVLPKKTTPGAPITGEIYIDGVSLRFIDSSGPTTRTVITDAFQISTSSPLSGGGALTSNLTLSLGTVPIANGGLGSTTWSAGDIAVMNNAGTAFTRLPLGTDGQFLAVNTGLSPQLEWITGGSGVTSVAMTLPTSLFTSPPSGSPITTSGTFAVALANQTGNVVFASPSGGGSGAPTFRSLVTNDLPTVVTSKGGTNITSYTTGDILYCSASNVLSKLPIGTTGQILTVAAGIPSWATSGGGTGTVTSVGLGLPAGGELTNTGTASPITTSGTYTLAWATQTTNKVFAAPDGSTGTPTFRTLVAGDLPTVTIGKGGTNITSYTTGDILYASATNVLSKLAAGTNGHVLTLASGVPSWAAASGGGGFTHSGSTTTSGFTAAVQNAYSVDTSGGAVTCTLPTAVGNAGKEIVVEHVTTGNNLTFNTTSSQTISGQASGAIVNSTRYNVFRFMSNGTNWMML